MKFINFTVIRIALAYGFGVITAYTTTIAILYWLTGLGISILLLTIIWFLERKKLRQGASFGMLAYLIFFLLGASNYQFEKPRSLPRHYSHFLQKDNSTLLEWKITEVLKPDQFSRKYIAKVIRIDSQKVEGKVLVSIPKSSIKAPLEVDNLILSYSKVTPVPPPLNPHQFDYKQYLEHLGIYFTLVLTEDEILRHRKGRRTIKGYSEAVRNNAIRKLATSPIQPKQRAILQALVLGQRNDIDKALYKEYAAAGALHILAVSGLHVGILYLLFSFLLKPLESFRFGRRFKSILIILSLWSFAVLVGLSPSVVRAVTMFTFFALGGLLNRPTHSFNTLFLSFLTLLIISPNWLFHVGFQLSYLAVFFIIWIQPKLYPWYRPRYYLDKALWGIITVTIAAQLGIAPLSIYYFHQFPGLFFLTNLVILPFLSMLLVLGLLVVILSLSDLLPNRLAQVYDESIFQLNRFVG